MARISRSSQRRYENLINRVGLTRAIELSETNDMELIRSEFGSGPNTSVSTLKAYQRLLKSAVNQAQQESIQDPRMREVVENAWGQELIALRELVEQQRQMIVSQQEIIRELQEGIREIQRINAESEARQLTDAERREIEENERVRRAEELVERLQQELIEERQERERLESERQILGQRYTEITGQTILGINQARESGLFQNREVEAFNREVSEIDNSLQTMPERITSYFELNQRIQREYELRRVEIPEDSLLEQELRRRLPEDVIIEQNLAYEQLQREFQEGMLSKDDRNRLLEEINASQTLEDLERVRNKIERERGSGGGVMGPVDVPPFIDVFPVPPEVPPVDFGDEDFEDIPGDLTDEDFEDFDDFIDVVPVEPDKEDEEEDGTDDVIDIKEGPETEKEKDEDITPHIPRRGHQPGVRGWHVMDRVGKTKDNVPVHHLQREYYFGECVKGKDVDGYRIVSDIWDEVGNFLMRVKWFRGWITLINDIKGVGFSSTLFNGTMRTDRYFLTKTDLINLINDAILDAEAEDSDPCHTSVQIHLVGINP